MKMFCNSKCEETTYTLITFYLFSFMGNVVVFVLHTFVSITFYGL